MPHEPTIRTSLSTRARRLWVRLQLVLGLVALVGSALGLQTRATAADVFLNEVLFNPPGTDTNSEYLELRGPPNYVLPAGTWFVAVEGDASGNPGTVQNTIDLSGRTLGQNGFLILFQRLHRYKPHVYANALTNLDTGEGWGSGSSSSLDHRGENGQTEFENASTTFFLVRSATEPDPGDDIDANDDGTPDGTLYAGWTVLDAIGAADGDGNDDALYGRLNFARRPDGGGPGPKCGTGPVITVPFTPGYLARNGNTTGWAESDWVAGANLLGAAPKWKLAPNSTLGTNTHPATRAGAVLNNPGSPNFAAPVLPSVLVREIGPGTIAPKGGKPDGYLLSLTTVAAGPVTVRATAPPPLQISLDGRTYGSTVDVSLLSQKSRKVLVRTPADNAAGPNGLRPTITHTIVTTADPDHYPTTLLIRPVQVTVTDPSSVVLSEAKVNPPGADDGPYEYIELQGPAGRMITNLYVVAVPGNRSGTPGRTDLVVNLSGQRFGTNGQLILAAPNHPPLGTNANVLLVPELGAAPGALDNGTLSLLLIGTYGTLPQGVDLDAGDNGTLEGLPPDSVIQDAVAWRDGDGNDVLYGPVDITQRGFTPDAVSRFPGQLTPNSAAAWMAGDLLGTNGTSLTFDPDHGSTNLPPGSLLTPGIINATAPTISSIAPLSHVLGDTGNPAITFTVADEETPAANLAVTAVSDNPEVVPNGNLTLSEGTAGQWTLRINAVGVGYATIEIQVSDGRYVGLARVPFAASAPGRAGGLWHTGVSDASTAIPLDSRWMLIGDDENQVLRVYSRTQSGPPVSILNLNRFLGLVDFYNDNPTTPKEVDIEGSTRVGNRLFWLGSHSHSADTLERTNRARLFATDLSGSGTNIQLRFVGRYDFLKLDLLNWDELNRHGKGANYYGFTNSAAIGVDPKSPDGSGFNMEGLCMAPGSTTTAYLGFRAPLIPPARARALLLPVTNFTTLAANGGPPGSARFGPPIELDLGGRGIRSIEGIGTNYLIVAGPSGTGANLPPPGDFRLFTWSGKASDQPVERSASLSGLNVEGIVELPAPPWTATTRFQLVTDGGTNIYYGDDIPAKQLEIPEFKKFRTDLVELGGVAASRAVIRSTLATRDGLRLEWFSRTGTRYQLQARSSLSAPWQNVGPLITAIDAVSITTLPYAQAQGFFRIVTADSLPDAAASAP